MTNLDEGFSALLHNFLKTLHHSYISRNTFSGARMCFSVVNLLFWDFWDRELQR